MCVCLVYSYICIFLIFPGEVTVDARTTHAGSRKESFGSDLLDFVQEEIQDVLARHPQLSMEDDSVREALEAFAQEFSGAYARHLAAQQKLREKMPKPAAQEQLERLEGQLTTEEAAFWKESSVVKSLSDEIARLQRVCEGHQKSLENRNQQMDRIQEEIAEQRELVRKSADPRLRSRLEERDTRFRQGMVVFLQDRISEVADDV